MTIISLSLEDDLLVWIDQLVDRGVIKNRSEAVRGGIYQYIRDQLGIQTASDLRAYLKKKQKSPFQTGVEVIRSVREEE
jgi:Arc/MetJ-type ribon-helix-helix transcriptional regulator